MDMLKWVQQGEFLLQQGEFLLQQELLYASKSLNRVLSNRHLQKEYYSQQSASLTKLSGAAAQRTFGGKPSSELPAMSERYQAASERNDERAKSQGKVSFSQADKEARQAQKQRRASLENVERPEPSQFASEQLNSERM
eukprot:6769555-Pyramimonas_sp.AAC.2